jgi:peptidase E
MTTYLLHGGKTSTDNAQNDAFFRQLVKLVPKDDVKILMCYWARPQEEWEPLLKRDSEKILRQTDKKVAFDLVNDPQDLFLKLPTTEVLYVAGGDAPPIERYYSDLSGLKHALDGKVYAGSSMGAFLASKNYVLSFDEQDSDTVHAGVGLLPLNTLVHWDKEMKKQEKLQLLKSVDPDTPIFTLNEFEWVTMYG